MSSGVRNHRATDAPWPLFDFESGVQVNALDVEELFALYERTGFLYPAKAARLTPHLTTVQDNWRRLLQAGDSSLLYVLTAGDEREGRASVAVWRTTRDSWVWQHLVGERNPLSSRAVMLGGLARCMRLDLGDAQQNWFRPENRFPSRVFGSIVEGIGESFASVRHYLYFAMPRGLARQMKFRAGAAQRAVEIVPYDPSHQHALCTVATLSRGALYVTAEELDRDVELRSVDGLYRAVGLRRSRQVLLAYRDGTSDAIAAAIVYRGPLGLNFSFLENRCDLILIPGLTQELATAATSALIGHVATAYADFELDDFPVVADGASAETLAACGGQFLRNYCQAIWLKGGHPSLGSHVDRFYSRVLRRVDRFGAPSPFTA